jgi:putative transposase
VGYYRRHLPHWQPQNKPLFVTWRLYGSLPRVCEPPAGSSAGVVFRWFDGKLDAAASGPVWLARHDVASVVEEAVHYGQETLARYRLFAYVVMANHVHMLLEPGEALSVAMKTLKGYTARRSNAILNRRGQFWQHESFDHWVRSEAELRRIASYIENNPVKAGLVSRPEDHRWSSAYGRASRQACP